MASSESTVSRGLSVLRRRSAKGLPLALLATVLLLGAGPANPATTGPSGLPLPRFVSVNSDKVNVRKGPGLQYPIAWVFVRRGMPVEIIAEYDLWRQIRDHDNAVGWVQKNLLSGRRTGLVSGAVRELRREPRPDSAAVALLEPGVIGEIKKCEGDWCALRLRNYDGWIRRDEIWGVFPDEAID